MAVSAMPERFAIRMGETTVLRWSGDAARIWRLRALIRRTCGRRNMRIGQESDVEAANGFAAR